MNIRAIGVVIICFALSGCASASWDSVGSVADYFGFGDSDEAPASDAPDADDVPVVVTPTAPRADGAETFCKGYADSLGRRSAQLGSSLEIQKKIAEDAYRQCIDSSGDWLD